MTPAYVFRMYVAGDTTNSVRALVNLYAICSRHYPDSHRIEIVDVFKNPERVIADGIIVTPSLVKISPLPKLTIIGDLSDEVQMLHALGLPQKEAA